MGAAVDVGTGLRLTPEAARRCRLSACRNHPPNTGGAGVNLKLQPCAKAASLEGRPDTEVACAVLEY